MSEIDPNRKVRVAIDYNGLLISAGDPNNVELDLKYMDLAREGYIVKVITYSEYKELKWAYKTESNE